MAGKGEELSTNLQSDLEGRILNRVSVGLFDVLYLDSNLIDADFVRIP